jgi:hypothetical protein
MQVHLHNQLTPRRLTDDEFRSGYPPMPTVPERGKLTLPWSLLLLGVGYFLLVAGPLWSSRLSAGGLLSDSGSGSPWLPAPAAAGLALLGAAALIFVIARLVRDVEQRPYASIAPVLAVFSGFILTSTRAELGLPGMGSSQLGLLVLTLALLGGVLIGRAGLSERALGWVLALLPTVALFWMVMAVHGASNPLALLQRVDSPVCTYLVLLAVSSLAMAAVGTVARRLQNAAAKSALYAPIPMPRVDPATFRPHTAEPRTVTPLAQRAARAVAQHVAYNEQVARTQQPAYGTPLLHNSQRMSTGAGSVSRTMPGYAVGQPAHAGVARHPGPTGYVPQPTSADLALDDPDLLLLTRRKYPVGRIASIAAAVAVVGIALSGAYSYLVPAQSGSRPSGLGAREAADRAQLRASPDSPRTQATAPALSAGRPLSTADAPLTTVPTVTPLSPSAPASTSFRTEPPFARAPEGALRPARDHARREHASSHRRDHSPLARGTSAGEPKPVAERVAVEASKPARATPASAHTRTADDGEPNAEPATGRESKREREAKAASLESKAPGKPAATAPKAAAVAPAKSQNSDDLDLDELVQKALKGGKGNVAAADDPILGL